MRQLVEGEFEGDDLAPLQVEAGKMLADCRRRRFRSSPRSRGRWQMAARTVLRPVPRRIRKGGNASMSCHCSRAFSSMRVDAVDVFVHRHIRKALQEIGAERLAVLLRVRPGRHGQRHGQAQPAAIRCTADLTSACAPPLAMPPAQPRTVSTESLSPGVVHPADGQRVARLGAGEREAEIGVPRNGRAAVHRHHGLPVVD